jgi:putative NADH-flavin reductase
MKTALLGASGSVGQRFLEKALSKRIEVAAQTRHASKLVRFKDNITICEFEPFDIGALRRFVAGQDAVVFLLGVDHIGKTDLFSRVTSHLIPAMKEAGCKRLIAVTGIGAGETRGHGGLFYDWFIYPLFTRHRYADKTAQEKMIAESGLDWTIVRPAPFVEKMPPTPFEAHTAIQAGTVLRRITRDEVADFILEELLNPRYVHQKPFIGHA